MKVPCLKSIRDKNGEVRIDVRHENTMPKSIRKGTKRDEKKIFGEFLYRNCYYWGDAAYYYDRILLYSA